MVSGSVAVNFVNDSKLLVQPGMTGATGNIYTGLHEFQDMSFLLHMLRGNDLFVDVGANVGSYTVLASAVIGAKSLSIEPIPSTFKHLIQNIILNDIKHLVTAYNIGVDCKEGILRFTSDRDTINHVVNEKEVNCIDTIEVKVSSLDNIIGKLQATLIKIDVEGFETNVVSGADSILSADSVEAVIMELNGSGNRYGFDEAKLNQKMLNYGFKTFIYSPFDRTLIPLNGHQIKSGNTLYIRNVNKITERLVSAPAFYVNNRKL